MKRSEYRLNVVIVEFTFPLLPQFITCQVCFNITYMKPLFIYYRKICMFSHLSFEIAYQLNMFLSCFANTNWLYLSDLSFTWGVDWQKMLLMETPSQLPLTISIIQTGSAGLCIPVLEFPVRRFHCSKISPYNNIWWIYGDSYAKNVISTWTCMKASLQYSRSSRIGGPPSKHTVPKILDLSLMS